MCLAGLHEGVRSLVEGGVPPGFLIIDDGWQCTDVDEPLRQVRSLLGLFAQAAKVDQPLLVCTQTTQHMT